MLVVSERTSFAVKAVDNIISHNLKDLRLPPTSNLVLAGKPWNKARVFVP